jgi:hypothetical protein
MRRAMYFLAAVLVALGIFIWASDRVTLEGERTVYAVTCVQGTWDGLLCSGQLAAADRHRFRSSRSRHEIVYWIAGSSAPSGKYSNCDVTDRDRWKCEVQADELPSITHEMSEGRPVPHPQGIDQPFYAVNKWKWWSMHWGIPWFTTADYSNAMNPRARKPTPADTGKK